MWTSRFLTTKGAVRLASTTPNESLKPTPSARLNSGITWHGLMSASGRKRKSVAPAGWLIQYRNRWSALSGTTAKVDRRTQPELVESS